MSRAKVPKSRKKLTTGIALPPDVLRWVREHAVGIGTSVSGYLTTLLRAAMRESGE